MRHISTNSGLAHANINHVGIRIRDCDRAHRSTLKIAIGHVLPDDAAIRRLPDTASSRAEIEGLCIYRVACYSDHTTTSIWTDQTPFKRLQQLRIDGGCELHRWSLIALRICEFLLLMLHRCVLFSSYVLL